MGAQQHAPAAQLAKYGTGQPNGFMGGLMNAFGMIGALGGASSLPGGLSAMAQQYNSQQYTKALFAQQQHTQMLQDQKAEQEATKAAWEQQQAEEASREQAQAYKRAGYDFGDTAAIKPGDLEITSKIETAQNTQKALALIANGMSIGQAMAAVGGPTAIDASLFKDSLERTAKGADAPPAIRAEAVGVGVGGGDGGFRATPTAGPKMPASFRPNAGQMVPLHPLGQQPQATAQQPTAPTPQNPLAGVKWGANPWFQGIADPKAFDQGIGHGVTMAGNQLQAQTTARGQDLTYQSAHEGHLVTDLNGQRTYQVGSRNAAANEGRTAAYQRFVDGGGSGGSGVEKQIASLEKQITSLSGKKALSPQGKTQLLSLKRRKAALEAQVGTIHNPAADLYPKE